MAILPEAGGESDDFIIYIIIWLLKWSGNVEYAFQFLNLAPVNEEFRDGFVQAFMQDDEGVC